MKYKKQITSGICVSILVWLSLIIADFIDEIILNVGVFIGAFNFLVMPFIMIICYIRNYIQHQPKKKETLVWFVSYYVMYVILWCVIIYLVDIDKFIIQKKTPGVIDLNGIEYTFYGFSTLLFFTILSLIFHLVYYIIKKHKK